MSKKKCKEITLIWVVRYTDNNFNPPIKANEAIFTFVAVDKKRNPTKIPQLKPETAEEKKRFDGALRRRQLSLVLAGKMKAEDATELKALFN